jgi:hypothetical protein
VIHFAQTAYEVNDEDFDHQIIDLFSSINFKSQNLKRQLNMAPKPSSLMAINLDLEVDLSRCDEEDL